MREDKTIQPGTQQPSEWVIRFYPLIKPSGRVLDVACGSGRHFGLGRASGRRLVGVDRDIAQASSFAPSPDLHLIEADLEDGRPFPFRGETFDGVIVTNYLWRPILPAIVASVAPDGVLIYETFGLGQERFGRPSNPDFLLRPGELIDAVAGKLEIVAYEHRQLEHPARIVQRIAAIGRAKS